MPIQRDAHCELPAENEAGTQARTSAASADDMLRELDRRDKPAVVVTFAGDGEPQVAVAAPGDSEAREAARKAAEALARFAEDRKDSAE
ncbi:MAG TPA: hypothetical protein VND64_20885 [Pirellulales bacterium]|nr:hypothetical protein [Pirellulales bacterium]